MSILDNLKLIGKLASENGLSKPWVVGGMIRDQHLGNDADVVDVDITTGDEDASKLARLFADSKKVELHGNEEEHHFFVIDDKIKYDFSKDFKYPGIDALLAKIGINSPTELQKETFSRDFTINTLLKDVNLKEELDLTGRGISDIKKRILSCPVPCDISFKHDPRRILRAFNYRAKYAFKFSKDVQDAIKKNIPLLVDVDSRYSSEILNKIIKESPDMLDELVDSGIFKYVKLTKFISDLLIKNNKILDVLSSQMQVIRPNMDLNEGLSKKLDEVREDDAQDGIIPLEDVAYSDTKENNKYWKEMGDSDAAKDFQDYAKKVKSKKLPVLQVSAIIRGPLVRECPFGLPIPYACKNAGTTVDQMTGLDTVDEEQRAKYAKINKRVYVYSQKGERCVYADKIVENSDKVNCDYNDSGARMMDFAQSPSPYYPRIFNGLGQYGLFAYPLNEYSDINNARDMFAGAYSVYAHSGDIQIHKEGTEPVEIDVDIAIKDK